MNLAFLQIRGTGAAAKRLLLEGRPHHLAALKASPRHPVYRKFYRNHLGLLAEVHAGLLEQEDAVRTAETLWARGGRAGGRLRRRLLSEPVHPDCRQASTSWRPFSASSGAFYGAAAMRQLREAVSRLQGRGDHEEGRRSDSVRQRPDFQKLLAD